MRVDVDAAGQHVLTRRVDRLVGLHVDRGSNQRDLLVFDQHVTFVLIDRGHDRAALDECAHLSNFFALAAGPHPRRELTLTPRRGFPVRGEVWPQALPAYPAYPARPASEPAADRHLLVGVELEGVPAVDLEVAEEAA